MGRCFFSNLTSVQDAVDTTGEVFRFFPKGNDHRSDRVTSTKRESSRSLDTGWLSRKIQSSISGGCAVQNLLNRWGDLGPSYHDATRQAPTHQFDAVAVDFPVSSPLSPVDGVIAAASALTSHGLLPVPIVDEGELDERSEDEGRACVHPNVDRLRGKENREMLN